MVFYKPTVFNTLVALVCLAFVHARPVTDMSDSGTTLRPRRFGARAKTLQTAAAQLWIATRLRPRRFGARAKTLQMVVAQLGLLSKYA
ncbi:hypothetical protein BJ138DRAFT_1168833, partial [Hygrophoropsis aurantiaca]